MKRREKKSHRRLLIGKQSGYMKECELIKRGDTFNQMVSHGQQEMKITKPQFYLNEQNINQYEY